jgi:hypothetical protein
MGKQNKGVWGVRKRRVLLGAFFCLSVWFWQGVSFFPDEKYMELGKGGGVSGGELSNHKYTPLLGLPKTQGSLQDEHKGRRHAVAYLGV